MKLIPYNLYDISHFFIWPVSYKLTVSRGRPLGLGLEIEFVCALGSAGI